MKHLTATERINPPMANSPISLSSSEAITISVLEKELGSPSIDSRYRECIIRRIEYIKENLQDNMATP
tara:strand:+ start:1078 stop:1281 length:204 start_codon:yes stop_codon:yes gene_type:complete